MIDLPEIRKKPAKLPYRKPTAVKELEKMAFEHHYRYSVLPIQYRTPFRFRDDSANGLTDCIVKYISLSGGFVSRYGGIYDRKLGKFRPGTNRKGLPDIIGTFQGKSIFVEVKFGRDKMSEHQEKVRDEQTASGGLFYLAHNFTEFKDWFDRLINKNPGL